MCPLHGPVNDMNSCKVILAQAKAISLTWLNACGGSAGHVIFQGAKKRPAEVEELNALVSNAVKEVIKTDKHLNAKSKNESDSEDKQKHFNF